MEAPRAQSANCVDDDDDDVELELLLSDSLAAVTVTAGGAGGAVAPPPQHLPPPEVHNGDDGTSPSSAGSTGAVTSIDETTLSTKARWARTWRMVVESQCSMWAAAAAETCGGTDDDDDEGDDGAGVVWSEPSTTCSMRVEAAINVPARPMPALQWQMNGARSSSGDEASLL